MDTSSVDPQTRAGDPIAYAAHRQAQEELLTAAAAMRWLQDRQQHTPEEMLEGSPGPRP